MFAVVHHRRSTTYQTRMRSWTQVPYIESVRVNIEGRGHGDMCIGSLDEPMREDESANTNPFGLAPHHATGTCRKKGPFFLRRRLTLDLRVGPVGACRLELNERMTAILPFSRSSDSDDELPLADLPRIIDLSVDGHMKARLPRRNGTLDSHYPGSPCLERSLHAVIHPFFMGPVAALFGLEIYIKDPQTMVMTDVIVMTMVEALLLSLLYLERTGQAHMDSGFVGHSEILGLSRGQIEACNSGCGCSSVANRLITLRRERPAFANRDNPEEDIAPYAVVHNKFVGARHSPALRVPFGVQNGSTVLMGVHTRTPL
ncbi:hypothetical protein BC826DRAFT_1178338 [Russula brevipes]|nr:hypothetical protein BC826DRAFT_1178338 [Russula brevipes]